MTTARVDEARLRPAGRATREAIETAAHGMFTTQGYDETSVRAIAAAAQVDPALVIRHFGSKEELFLHVIDRTEELDTVYTGPVESFGRTVIGAFVSDEGARLRASFVTLAAAAHHENVRAVLLRRTRETFLAPLVERVAGPHPEQRLMMAGAALHGLFQALYVYRTQELVDADRDFLIETYGDAIQRIITP